MEHADDATIQALIDSLQDGPIPALVQFNFKMWEKTQNPLFIWETIRHCILRNGDLPQWCMDYLLNVSNELVTNTDFESKNIDSHLKKALGINFNHYRYTNKAKHETTMFSLIKYALSKSKTFGETIEWVSKQPGVPIGEESLKKLYYGILEERSEWEEIFKDWSVPE